VAYISNRVVLPRGWRLYVLQLIIDPFYEVHVISQAYSKRIPLYSELICTQKINDISIPNAPNCT
jgi:hypothetical protein